MIILTLCIGTTPSLFLGGTTYGPWLIYTGITGVGDVSKTSPAEDDLHYAGNDNPEYGSFTVATGSAVDNDRRCVIIDGEFDHWQVEDAGLNSVETDWQCTAGAIDDGSFSATYTPPNVPTSGIVVKVDVFDGLNYNSNDAKVTRQYATPLKAFKVGVHLTASPTGGNYKKWEDGTTEGTAPVEPLVTFAFAHMNNTVSDSDTCDSTWTLITNPDGCSIHGTIKGSAVSNATGGHDVMVYDDDWIHGGSGSASVGVTILIISFSYSWSLDDNCVAIASAGIGYGSDYGTEYEEACLTAVSWGGTTNDDQDINASPGTGEWTGKEGAHKHGKWTAEGKAISKEWQNTSVGRAETDASCTFGIPNNPSYLP